MHDVVLGAGDQVQLTVFPERFIIEPDPPPPGGNVGGGSRPSAGDVLLVAALPDPTGTDDERESVIVLNTTARRSIWLVGQSPMPMGAVTYLVARWWPPPP
ncbi:MAG: hypothetical protein M3252_05280 [Actinomycetota bacterium]|nr:hypothetical protein [Actinomycetota bacterium]